MKSTIKLFFIAIILLLFNKISNAQIEDHYHSFSGNIYIPIIVDHQEVWESKNGDITEKHIPDKQINIYFYLKAEDMSVNDNVFSGIIIKKHAALDEVITYKGKVSEDKQMMEFLEITKDAIQYLTGKREVIEKEVTLSARFENIPTWYGRYRFKYGITKIASVKYNEEYSIPHYGRKESYTESFVKINEEKITKNTTNCIQASFKPGVLKPDQVTHVTIEGPDTVCRCVEKKQGLKKPFRIELNAKSDIMAGSFKWECNSDAILLKTIEGNSAEIRIRALAEYLPSPDNVLIKVTQKIGVVEFSATHILHLRGGYYYFWPDCDKLLELGIITKDEWEECDGDLYDCFDWLESSPCNQGLEPKYLPFILQEHLLSASGLADPDFKLDSEKLNWFYKLWDENGDTYPEGERAKLRDFVKTYPCMEKWVKLGNRKK